MRLTNQTASVLFLFVAGILVTGVLAGVLVATAARLEVAAGAWLIPSIAIACCSLAFFAGRRHVYPVSIANSAARALLVTVIWLTATGAIAAAAVWMARAWLPAGISRFAAILPFWLLVLLASRNLLSKLGSRRDREVA